MLFRTGPRSTYQECYRRWQLHPHHHHHHYCQQQQQDVHQWVVIPSSVTHDYDGLHVYVLSLCQANLHHLLPSELLPATCTIHSMWAVVNVCCKPKLTTNKRKIDWVGFNVPPNTLQVISGQFYESNDPTNSVKALKDNSWSVHQVKGQSHQTKPSIR